jgi:DNA-binding ferritin-like protein (Dps family)
MPPPDASAPPEPPAPGPENAWVIRYGTLLQESVSIVKTVLTETAKSKSKKLDPIEKTRVLQKLPKEYIRHMYRIIQSMDNKTKTKYDRERIIADVLDILQLKMKLTPAEIKKSYEFHKTQKRLQKFIDK